MEKMGSFSYRQGDSLLDAPQDLFIPQDPLQVSLDQFSGPLDLLLYLIRKDKLAVEDIDIAKIALQYEEYLKLMRRFNLQLAAEYLVMAAILAEIKSFSLLPHIDEEEKTGEKMQAELMQRLREYELICALAGKLEAMPRLERDFFSFQLSCRSGRTQQSRAIVPAALGRTMTEVLARRRLHGSYELQPEEISTKDRMMEMLKRLRKASELKTSAGFISFENFLVAAEGHLGVAVTFISLLQLIRDGLVEVRQKENYQRIFIRLSLAKRQAMQ